MSLIAAYSFDESGNTVLDMSGNGRDFALTTDAQRVAGHMGGGVQPATTTGVQLPDMGQTDERTVCMWVKGSIPDGWPVRWYDPSAAGGSGGGVWGILFLGGVPIIRARNGADDFTDATAAWPDTTNWHHIAGTFGGGAVKLYLDGVLADQQSLVGPIRIANAPTLFGGWNLAGSFDDLRIYDAALGASSITASMAPVRSSDLASAGALAIDAAFLARVTAAAQQYGVQVAKAVLANPDGSSQKDKARFNLSRTCLASPAAIGQQFAWAIGSDAAVDSTIDDDTIRSMVVDVWNIVAGVPI